MPNVIGVDIGTGSVRAALIQFDMEGVASILSIYSVPITTHNPAPDFYEQNSHEVWSSVVTAVVSCLQRAGTSKVDGIAFTATCSLVIVDGDLDNDIIMWMDHRAVKEAQDITNTKHPRLNQAGGICSPEFSLAKILWLKRNRRDVYDRCLCLLELPDYLTWKCLGSVPIDTFSPSICSLVCKWFFEAECDILMYDVKKDKFFEEIGLHDLFSTKRNNSRFPTRPGSFEGYMADSVKKEMGIDVSSQVSVATSIIDAHAGVFGMVTLFSNYFCEKEQKQLNIDSILCSIAGTSTCHMVLTRDRKESRGIWGPYKNVVIPDYYVREPGQSATGKLIDHVISSHPEKLTKYAGKTNSEIVTELNRLLSTGGQNKLAINPSFHGNRSPLADPTLRGGIYGLTLEETPLETLYAATIQSLCYEAKLIVERLEMPSLQSIIVSGGLAKNSFFLQTYADVLEVDVVAIECGTIDMMLVGTGIMALQAHKHITHHIPGSSPGHCCVLDKTERVSFKDMKLNFYHPNLHTKKYHEKKFQAFRTFLKASQEIQAILNEL